MSIPKVPGIWWTSRTPFKGNPKFMMQTSCQTMIARQLMLGGLALAASLALSAMAAEPAGQPASFPAVAPNQPHRPANFKPFQYQYSTEQLMETFSANQMRRAETEWKAIQAVNDKGPWKPTWESLDQHQAPEWFLDGKLGIMINWGLHAVPAWGKDQGDKMATYPDAYGCVMYGDSESEGTLVKAYHAKYWGADFQWDDFMPMWKADAYNPELWVKVMEEAGVRYVVPFSKHHDGIAWWDSQWTQRNTVRMGPKQDVLTPLIAAARNHGGYVASPAHDIPSDAKPEKIAAMLEVFNAQ